MTERSPILRTTAGNAVRTVRSMEVVTTTRRRWPRVALAVTLVAVVAVDRSPLVGVIVVFALVVPFERLFPRHPQPLRRPGLGTDLAYGLAQPVFRGVGAVVGIALALASLAWVPGLLLRPAVHHLPVGPRVLFGIVLVDAVIYWAHRWSHQVPLLWRFHSVHHSSERMDWLSGVRSHPFDGLVAAPAIALLLAAGFTSRFAGVLAVAQFVTGLFLHANVRWRWRPLQRLVITPEFHHWHHSSEADACNTNFAAFLPIWDLVFGTWFMPRDRRPQVYGTTTPVPEGFVAQLVNPLHGLRNPLRALRRPVVALRQLRRDLRRGLHQVAEASRRPRRVAGPSPW